MMATAPILVLTPPTGVPTVVDATDPALIGQVVVDFITESPTTTTFSVLVAVGELHTPDA